MKTPAEKAPPGPLKGVKILDLSRVLAGPTCTMILADMGAETIKIEHPKDSLKHRTAGISGGSSFDTINRNKKSITLNLHSKQATDILTQLVKWADVVVENFRPGFMKRIGFDYPAIKEINPRAILTSISGYGQTGPYAHRAAFDSIGQAMGGLMSVTGPADMPPVDAGAAISDISAGVFGALGTALALYHQQSTGLGQHVDASLVESIVFLMGFNFSLFNAGDSPEKGGMFSPTRTPGAGMFLTKDNVYLIIMAQSDQHWPILARLIGREQLLLDSEYGNRVARAKHGHEIAAMIDEWVSSKGINEIETILENSKIPFGRVQTLPELLKDPHLSARGRFQMYESEGKSHSMIAPYPILSETPGRIHSLWPAPGQHNEEIYHHFLGYSLEELDVFKAEGII